MRKKLLLLMGLVMSVVAMAAPVTLEQAQQRAQQFMARRGTAHNMRLAKQQLRIEQAQQDNAYYYVFNVGEQQGFVIVSGDDRTPDILGYADSGSFSDQDMPDNMRAWLQGYEDQMKWMEETGYQAPSRRIVGARSSINPLLTCTWDQKAPYYNNTPTYKVQKGSDENGNPIYEERHCVTGCVATAMAQVMYYHRWPQAGTTSIPSYTTNTTFGQLDELPATTFNWGAMYDNYNNGEDGSAVAQLMRYCGQSVEMNYGSSSSAQSWKVARALKAYFDYDNTVANISRESYTAEQWSDIIYTELKEGRPVIYGGSSSGGGHEFVIDGYDENELFHFNWGWGGAFNGCFLLAVANPYSNSGAGSSSSTDGYSFSQDATIGVQPQKGTPIAALVMTSAGLTTSTESVSRSNSSEDFSGISITIAIWNKTTQTADFQIGVGVFDSNDELVYAKSIISNITLDHNQGFGGISPTISLGANLPDGDYQLKNISRPAGTDTWYKDVNADNHVVYMTISGNTLTLTNQSLSLAGSTIVASGSLETGAINNLNTTITNNGTFFNGYLYLFVDGALAGGRMFEVDGGATKTFSIEYIAKTAGTKALKICTDGEGANEIATGSVTITAPAGGEATDNVDLTISQEVINAEGSEVLGNTAQVKITVTNSTSSNYVGAIYLFTWSWKGNQGSGSGSGSYETIPANSTVELIRTSSELSGADKYSFSLGYVKNGAVTEDRSKVYEYYTPVEAYAVYDVAGNTTMKKAIASIDVPANVAVVDLRGQSVVQSVASQENPNTLFMLDEDASLSGATNVVKGSTAETISLTDGYDFYTPVAFTANSISYSREATLGFAKGSGWETITLPFDVDAVTANGEEIDWFHSSTDKGKNFWVMEFSGDDGSTVNFDYANEMSAYTPYIFTVPGDNYADEWNLVGKTLVFSGANAKIKASNEARATITGTSYKFVGATSAKSALTDVYLLNAEGSSFEYGSGDVKSFHAYFAPTTYQYATDMLSIGIGGGTTTGIAEMLPAQKKAEKEGIYHLNGMKVSDNLENLPAGIYIINGKKTVK
jgi:hypothetical protein